MPRAAMIASLSLILLCQLIGEVLNALVTSLLVPVVITLLLR